MSTLDKNVRNVRFVFGDDTMCLPKMFKISSLTTSLRGVKMLCAIDSMLIHLTGSACSGLFPVSDTLRAKPKSETFAIRFSSNLLKCI